MVHHHVLPATDCCGDKLWQEFKLDSNDLIVGCELMKLIVGCELIDEVDCRMRVD